MTCIENAGSPLKALPNGVRRLAHSWDRLEPVTTDRAIHVSLGSHRSQQGETGETSRAVKAGC